MLTVIDVLKLFGLKEFIILAATFALLFLLYVRITEPNWLIQYPLIYPVITLLMIPALLLFTFIEYSKLKDKDISLIDKISSIIRMPMYLAGAVFVGYVSYLDFLNV